jgi:Ser/Thr protein kinase RdoA (MazF antagonist)
VIIANLLEGYAEHQQLTAEWIERLPIFIKLREVMSFIDAYLEWDMTQLSVDQRIILNRYQNALENEVPVLHIDFKQFT